MDSITQLLAVGGALMFAAILAGALSQRLGVPVLLVFLVVGMLAGEDGPGRIEFDDNGIAFLVGNLALALILLDGGVRTRRSTFRVALRPGVVLATLGVVVTAVVTAWVARLVLDVEAPVALLLGAIVGSTDAAAVFAMLKSSATRLSDRVAYTLEIESGVNDPMAVLLTSLLVSYLTLPAGLTALAVAAEVARQFGFGALCGVGLGYVLDRALGAVHLDDGLRALLLCSGGVAVFGVTALVGGSGFLAVDLAGVADAGLELPAGAMLLLVVRDGKPFTPRPRVALAAGDVVVLAAPDSATSRLAQLFRDDWGRRHDDVAGELALDAATPFAEVAALYGMAPVPRALDGATLDQAIRRSIPFVPVEGDKTVIAGVGFVVREMRGSRIAVAALLLRRSSTPRAGRLAR